MSRSLSVKEVAEKLNIDDRTAGNWLRSGRIPIAFKPPGAGRNTPWIIPEERFNDWLNNPEKYNKSQTQRAATKAAQLVDKENRVAEPQPALYNKGGGDKVNRQLPEERDMRITCPHCGNGIDLQIDQHINITTSKIEDDSRR